MGIRFRAQRKMLLKASGCQFQTHGIAITLRASLASEVITPVTGFKLV